MDNFNFSIRPQQIYIKPNNQQDLDVTGNMIMIVEATNEMQVSFDNGARTFIEKGIEYGSKDGSTYKRVTLHNNSDEIITGKVLLGVGSATDSRLSLTGDIAISQIQDPINVNDINILDVDVFQNRLRTYDSSAWSLLTSISTLLRGTNSNALLKAGCTDLRGMSHATASNSTVELVSAVNNTDGILIGYATHAGLNQSENGIYIDDVIFSPDVYAVANGNTAGHIRDIILPAGVKVELKSSHVSVKLNAFYEVL